MKTHTWPCGTKINVTMLNAFMFQGVPAKVVIDTRNKAGYVLLGDTASDAQPGDGGTITFTESGPTGGHWVFDKV